LNTLASHGLESYVNEATRIGVNKNNEKTMTCIDHVHARKIKINNVEVSDSGISDHHAILIRCETRNSNKTKINSQITDISKTTITYLDREKLKQLLQNETWTEINFQNTDTAFESFINIYNKLKNGSRKTILVQNRKKQNSKEKKRAPWISDQALVLVQQKKEIYKSMRKRKNVDETHSLLKLKFKKVSSQLVKQIRRDKSNYYGQKLKKCTTAKDYWRELKNICKVDQRNSENKIKLTDQEGQEISEPEKIVEILNNHYAAISTTEMNKNPLFSNNHTGNYTLNNEFSSVGSFVAYEITVLDVYHAIKKLANKDSSGEDGIRARELKEYWEELAIPLVLLFNFSLTRGEFPKILKKSTITPIPKISRAHLPENFRPISITSTVSRVFEIIIHNRMLKFLMKTKFFSKNQFGFLPKKNTTSALIAHLHEIVSNLEQKKNYWTLFGYREGLRYCQPQNSTRKIIQSRLQRHIP
jgi:hypothetical protein